MNQVAAFGLLFLGIGVFFFAFGMALPIGDTVALKLRCDWGIQGPMDYCPTTQEQKE